MACVWVVVNARNWIMSIASDIAGSWAVIVSEFQTKIYRIKEKKV